MNLDGEKLLPAAMKWLAVIVMFWGASVDCHIKGMKCTQKIPDQCPCGKNDTLIAVFVESCVAESAANLTCLPCVESCRPFALCKSCSDHDCLSCDYGRSGTFCEVTEKGVLDDALGILQQFKSSKFISFPVLNGSNVSFDPYEERKLLIQSPLLYQNSTFQNLNDQIQNMSKLLQLLNSSFRSNMILQDDIVPNGQCLEMVPLVNVVQTFTKLQSQGRNRFAKVESGNNSLTSSDCAKIFLNTIRKLIPKEFSLFLKSYFEQNISTNANIPQKSGHLDMLNISSTGSYWAQTNFTVNKHQANNVGEYGINGGKKFETSTEEYFQTNEFKSNKLQQRGLVDPISSENTSNSEGENLFTETEVLSSESGGTKTVESVPSGLLENRNHSIRTNPHVNLLGSRLENNSTNGQKENSIRTTEATNYSNARIVKNNSELNLEQNFTSREIPYSFFHFYILGSRLENSSANGQKENSIRTTEAINYSDNRIMKNNSELNLEQNFTSREIPYSFFHFDLLGSRLENSSNNWLKENSITTTDAIKHSDARIVKKDLELDLEQNFTSREIPYSFFHFEPKIIQNMKPVIGLQSHAKVAIRGNIPFNGQTAEKLKQKIQRGFVTERSNKDLSSSSPVANEQIDTKPYNVKNNGTTTFFLARPSNSKSCEISPHFPHCSSIIFSTRKIKNPLHTFNIFNTESLWRLKEHQTYSPGWVPSRHGVRESADYESKSSIFPAYIVERSLPEIDQSVSQQTGNSTVQFKDAAQYKSNSMILSSIIRENVFPGRTEVISEAVANSNRFRTSKANMLRLSCKISDMCINTENITVSTKEPKYLTINDKSEESHVTIIHSHITNQSHYKSTAKFQDYGGSIKKQESPKALKKHSKSAQIQKSYLDLEQIYIDQLIQRFIEDSGKINKHTLKDSPESKILRVESKELTAGQPNPPKATDVTKTLDASYKFRVASQGKRSTEHNIPRTSTKTKPQSDSSNSTIEKLITRSFAYQNDFINTILLDSPEYYHEHSSAVVESNKNTSIKKNFNVRDTKQRNGQNEMPGDTILVIDEMLRRNDDEKQSGVQDFFQDLGGPASKLNLPGYQSTQMQNDDMKPSGHQDTLQEFAAQSNNPRHPGMKILFQSEQERIAAKRAILKKDESDESGKDAEGKMTLVKG